MKLLLLEMSNEDRKLVMDTAGQTGLGLSEPACV